MSSPFDKSSPAEPAGLCKGQRLRIVRPNVAEREWGVGGDAVGTLLCCYRVRAGGQSSQRVDVAFGPGRTIWGAPAEAFAPLPGTR